MVIRYDTEAPPPSLAVAKGSAHTHMIMSPLLVKKMVELLMMGSRTSSARDLPTCG